jgi:hypothetical protein
MPPPGRLPLRLALPLAVAATASLTLPAQTPGQRPPADVVARVRPSLDAGKRALAAGDSVAIRRAVADAVAALGPWAGNPETATRYFPPPDERPFDPERLHTWWQRELERGVRGVVWRKNPSGNPRTMTAGLREAAFPIDALARTARLETPSRERLAAEARAGADWLLQRQHTSGVFPFPVGPGLNPREKVGEIVARAIRQRPEIVVDDWIPDDFGDGGLQFDNGLCGHALLSVWELTGDTRYLDGARRLAAWTLRQPVVTNWNYNAFSVGFLARLGRLTGEPTFLAGAIRKADLGVLPGQLPGGRWFDAHNACAVYHHILLRELLELAHALPAAHPFRPSVVDALTRGLDQAARETRTLGYTGTWTDNFARGLLWLGENSGWRAALNVNLNAAGQNGAPTPGFAAVPVLELLAARATQNATPRK